MKALLISMLLFCGLANGQTNYPTEMGASPDYDATVKSWLLMIHQGDSITVSNDLAVYAKTGMLCAILGHQFMERNPNSSLRKPGDVQEFLCVHCRGVKRVVYYQGKTLSWEDKP